jgi:hypothetical protein
MQINGWVAQLAEQWTENLAFCLGRLIALSIESEHLRHETNRKDGQRVNIASMASNPWSSLESAVTWLSVHLTVATLLQHFASFPGLTGARQPPDDCGMIDDPVAISSTAPARFTAHGAV